MVNVANGNLVFQNTDFSIRGTGLNFDLTRTYNSQGGPVTPDVGANWTTGLGPDVSLIDYLGNGNRTFIGPSGFVKTFTANGSGGWITPAGINADLTFDGTNYSMKFRRGVDTYKFNSSGLLLSHSDPQWQRDLVHLHQRPTHSDNRHPGPIPQHWLLRRANRHRL